MINISVFMYIFKIIKTHIIITIEEIISLNINFKFISKLNSFFACLNNKIKIINSLITEAIAAPADSKKLIKIKFNMTFNIIPVK